MIQFLEHTADIRVRITSPTFPDLFKESLKAMNQIMKKDGCQDMTYPVEITFQLSSMDSTLLLIDFLSTVLTQTLISNTLFCQLDFQQLDQDFLSVTLYGYSITAFEEDIKAVTYHEAEVIEKDGTWSTVIVFDI